MVAALTAPTINAGEVERLRKLSMANADKISALITQGMVASAQVLTPEQRKLAQAGDRQGRRSSSLGPARGVTFVDAAHARAKARGAAGFSMCSSRPR